MNVEDRQLSGGLGSVMDESVLAMAAASELTSPLVLLRQLGLALSDDIDENERRRLAQRMTLTSERALRLAANISLMSTDQATLPLEPINPISVCRDVIHELSPLFAAHGRTITLQQRSRIPLLVANRDLLQRILLGFGDNALHYATAERPIRMTITSYANKVRIGVRDYGPAVPINIWESLDGKILRRATVPLASRPQTSGVGLVAARRLAELMESTVGLIRHRDGATFYVDLHVSKQMSLL
ncbi:HAMP domain-containing histidine kinase [Candidatus Saccharibacteria bacterium]|nr:HAMP domain-containing histidine kinase [Candidatus Saccharibacteria bacterium]